MAFRYNPLSALVQSDPPAAYKQLEALFAVHGGSVAALAKEQSVDRGTVFRWLRKLSENGLGDPRGGERGITGPKPAAKKGKKASKA
jgi:transposase-like protein